MKDIEVLLGLNVCTDSEREKCLAEIGSREYLEWACAKCEKKSPRSIHPWTLHLTEIRHLMKGGYPFGKNDLSFEEWKDLGMLNELLDGGREG